MEKYAKFRFPIMLALTIIFTVGTIVGFAVWEENSRLTDAERSVLVDAKVDKLMKKKEVMVYSTETGRYTTLDLRNMEEYAPYEDGGKPLTTERAEQLLRTKADQSVRHHSLAFSGTGAAIGGILGAGVCIFLLGFFLVCIFAGTPRFVLRREDA